MQRFRVALRSESESEGERESTRNSAPSSSSPFTFTFTLPFLFIACLAGAAEGPHGGAHAGATEQIHEKINALQAACEKDPKAWEPRFELGKLCLQFGLAKLAVNRLDEAVALKTDSVDLYGIAGKAHFQLGEHDKAIALWKNALKLDPTADAVREWLTQAETRKAEDRQLADYDAALKQNPTDAAALFGRGRIRLARKDLKGASEDLEAAAKADPANLDAAGLAAFAHFQLGHLDQAIDLWTRVVKANPADTKSKAWLERATKTKEVLDRLAAVREQLAKAPAAGPLHLEAGDLLARLGRWREALDHLAKAVALLPKDPIAHKTYGLVLLRVGDMDKAVQELDTCAKLDPSNTGYPRLLEEVRRMRNMHKEMKGGGDVPSHGTSQKGDSQE